MKQSVGFGRPSRRSSRGLEDMDGAVNAKFLSAGAVTSAIAASICCFGPLVLAALGVGGGALVVAWPPLAATRTAAFEVSGWTCGSCAVATRIALKKLDGVQDVKTDPEKNEARVTYDDSKVTTDRMVEAIAKLSYKATLRNG